MKNSPRTPLFKKRGGTYTVFNIKDTLQKRKRLRVEQTEAETALWERLRARRLRRLKFFRQYGIGQYIADFYCPNLRLAIEVDGRAHFSKDGLEYDAERYEFFKTAKVRTIRFSNNEVLTRIEEVLVNIEEICLELEASPSLIKEGERGSL